jgi:hypothetical protein
MANRPSRVIVSSGLDPEQHRLTYLGCIRREPCSCAAKEIQCFES